MVKKLLVKLLATFIFVGMVTNPALAAKTPPPPDDDFSIGVQSLDLISSGDCTINDNGDRTISSRGRSFTQYVVDSVGVKLFLQKWNGSSWTDIASSVTFTEYNSDYADGYYKFSDVQPGYYYRIKAQHSAEDGGTKEQTESFSPYKYIN
ncbi:hypothetical protein MFMK1_003353 [Metallumcola ferriviriculae]|uniref:Uncharacterized protein n=1 Tax=Metallumcola ferriviriculae TaxID=3039180 RepID=A0AAU0UT64_9FIRM|nr:hypothetical protein MFMK1_003353 [Desulfitibacteraceae bacterium MK1]